MIPIITFGDVVGVFFAGVAIGFVGFFLLALFATMKDH